MFERRSLKTPIILGSTMIVLLVMLIVGWVLLTVIGAIREAENAPLYWTLLSVGSAVIAIVLLGVVMYLALSVKAISLNRRQSNFVDSVTHELKSPIASLKLCLQTLTRRTVNDKQRADFHRFMLDDVERLDQLINHLLDAGQLARRPVDHEIEDVPLDDVLADCAQSVCSRYRVDPATVRMDIESCSIRARRADLHMIFRNLIDNAVKYADANPLVSVRMRRADGDRATVWITDNGCGIPSRHRRRIFGRFVRLGLELERDKPGTGLGLAIVHTLVRRLGGRVRVRDPDEGTGTVFEVQLPAVTPSPPAPATQDSGNENTEAA